MNTQQKYNNRPNLTNPKMFVAFTALNKHVEPKPKYVLEGHIINSDTVEVSFYNENDDKPTKQRSYKLKAVYDFIEDFYNDTFDCFNGGIHEQYIDSTSPQVYFLENTSDVLADLINSRHA